MNPGIDSVDERKIALLREDPTLTGEELARRVGDTPTARATRGKWTPCGVSEVVCEAINRDHQDGMGGHRLAKKYRMSKSTVDYHLKQCSHEYTSSINEDKCVAIREAARDGKTHGEVADLFDNVSRQQARYHAVGECACSHDVPSAPAMSRGCWAKAE
jgi:hypothetical protein